MKNKEAKKIHFSPDLNRKEISQNEKCEEIHNLNENKGKNIYEQEIYYPSKRNFPQKEQNKYMDNYQREELENNNFSQNYNNRRELHDSMQNIRPYSALNYNNFINLSQRQNKRNINEDRIYQNENNSVYYNNRNDYFPLNSSYQFQRKEYNNPLINRNLYLRDEENLEEKHFPRQIPMNYNRSHYISPKDYDISLQESNNLNQERFFYENPNPYHRNHIQSRNFSHPLEEENFHKALHNNNNPGIFYSRQRNIPDIPIMSERNLPFYEIREENQRIPYNNPQKNYYTEGDAHNFSNNHGFFILIIIDYIF